MSNRAIEYTLKLLGARQVQQELDETGNAAGRADEKVGKFTGNTRGAARALRLLSPELGSIARELGNVGAALDVSIAASEAFGVSLGVVGAALGMAAAQAGVAYFAYQELSEGHIFAEETTKALTAAQKENEKASAQLQNAVIALKVEFGEYSEAMGRAMVRFREFTQSQQEAYSRMAQLRRQEDSLGAAIGDLAEGARGIPLIGDYSPVILALDAMTTSTKELRSENEAIQGQLARGYETLRETALAEEQLATWREWEAEATEKSTEATKKRTAAQVDNTRALRDAARAEEERLAAQSRAWASEFKAGQQMAAISSGQAGMAAAVAGVDMNAINAQIDSAIRQYRNQSLASGALGGVGAVSGALASGDLTSLLSLAGPQGAAAGAALSGLSALGSQSPAQTAAQVEAFSKAIVKGIEVLPEVLVEVLPQLAQTLAVELPIALIQTIPRLVQEVLSAWRGGGSTSIGALSERQRASLGGVSTGISSALSATAVASSSLPRDSAARASVSLQRALSRGGISRGPVIRLSSPSIFETIDAINLGSGPGGLREAY